MSNFRSDIAGHLEFASKFFKACGKAGLTLDELRLFTKDVTLLKQARSLLHNKMSEKEAGQHLIYTANVPSLPGGCSIVENQVPKNDSLLWDPRNLELFVTDEQKADPLRRIPWEKFKQALSRKTNLNAVVLDYLLSNQHLIPTSWQPSGRGGRRIYFWGTIYRVNASHSPDHFVRCMYWDGTHWCEGGKHMGQDFGADELAAVLR